MLGMKGMLESEGEGEDGGVKERLEVGDIVRLETTTMHPVPLIPRYSYGVVATYKLHELDNGVLEAHPVVAFRIHAGNIVRWKHLVVNEKNLIIIAKKPKFTGLATGCRHPIMMRGYPYGYIWLCENCGDSWERKFDGWIKRES